MVPNAPFLPKIIPENQYFSLRHAVACPTMTSPDGLIGIAQRLPGFIGFEAEMRLLQCEARRKRVCNQADLCKFAGCRRLPLAAKHRCLAFRIREPQAVVERTGGQMNSRRQSTSPALVSFIVSVVTIFGALSAAAAQNKPRENPSPQPVQNKDLLTVQPPPTKSTTPDSTSPKNSSLLETQQQKPGAEVDEKTQIIINTDLITFTVTVTDLYGRFVSGLGKNAFTIFDDKKQQEITNFSDDDAPVSVGVVFDITGSMSGEKVKRAREALAHFIQTSHDRDEYFLITL